MSNYNENWSSENDEILIDFVKNNESLYNVKSKQYRQIQLKQRLWNDIGTTLKKSGSDCCKRWAYIRDYYIRRRGKPGTGSGGEAAKKRCDLLSFMDSIPSTTRATTTNIVVHELLVDPGNVSMEDSQIEAEGIEIIEDYANDSIIEDEHLTSDEVPKNKRKRKISTSEERLQILKSIAQRNATVVPQELDENDLFFNSMAKSVKKLPRVEQIQLRMAIASLVGNAELRTLNLTPEFE